MADKVDDLMIKTLNKVSETGNITTGDIFVLKYCKHERAKQSQISNMEQNQYILGQLGNFYSKPSVNPNTCYNNYGCGGCNGCGCN